MNRKDTMKANKIINKLEQIVRFERATNPEVENDNYYIIINREDAELLKHYGNKDIWMLPNGKINKIYRIPVITSVYLEEPQLVGRLWKDIPYE